MVKFHVDYFADCVYRHTERFSCSFFIDAVHLAFSLSADGDTECCIYMIEEKDAQEIPALMAKIFIKPQRDCERVF